MRVCQFRHFGLVFQGLAGRQEISGSPYSYKDTRCCQHLNLKELLLWTAALSAFSRFAIVARASILKFHSRCVVLIRCTHAIPEHPRRKAFGMTNSSLANPASIPPELSTEIRRLMHDLSNALEIVLQAGYLLTTADTEEPVKGWIGLLDGGAQQALKIHQQLRDYIRVHS
jgi:hypothetical protein